MHFHGSNSNALMMGTYYTRKLGLNEIASNNNFVVVYPQSNDEELKYGQFKYTWSAGDEAKKDHP